MPTPLRLFRIILIAVIGLLFAVLTFGISLWITRHPTSLASSLPVDSTIFYLKTSDYDTLERWIKRMPALETPIPILKHGTRYEMALLSTQASPSWVISVYRGKIDGEDRQASSASVDALLAKSTQGHGPLSQSPLVRRFATQETASVIWIDTVKMSEYWLREKPMLQSLLLGAPQMLLIQPSDHHGSIVLDGIRVPRGLQRGAVAVSSEKDSIVLSAQNLTSLVSEWLSTLARIDPSLKEGMHGIIAGMTERWNIDDSLESIIQNIASMPLSLLLRFDDTQKQWHITVSGSIPMNDDRTTLLQALEERGKNGTVRTTSLDAKTTLRDIVEGERGHWTGEENVWSTIALGGSPELWMALRGSAFVLSTDTNKLPSAEGAIMPATKPALFSGNMSTSLIAKMISTLLPFMNQEILALRTTGLLSEELLTFRVEPVGDFTVVQWEKMPSGDGQGEVNAIPPKKS